MKQISFKRVSLLAASAAIAGLALLPVGAANAAKSGSALASWTTPGTYAWTVPNGIKKIHIDLFGAAGGDASGPGAPTAAGGLGGEAAGTFSVQPGQAFEIVVGGQGGAADALSTGAGGFNGGGDGTCAFFGFCAGDGAGGGGASDVRSGSCAPTATCDLHARILVAGGGGGAWPGSESGFGGGYFGGDGTTPGQGGSQTAGGAYGGTFGQGGTRDGGAGGGGGGWYGGGAGNGGGGGSGYILPAIFGSMQAGVQSGDGKVVITKAS